MADNSGFNGGGSGLSGPVFSASTDHLSTLPGLPEDISFLYGVLDAKHRRLFVKVFRWCWEYVNGHKLSGGVYYWALDWSRRRLKLRPSQLAVLSCLYFLSGGGVKVVRSDQVVATGILQPLLDCNYQVIINYLLRHGYLTRSTRDPSAPYLSRSYSQRKIFITLTSKGVNAINQVNRELKHKLLNTSINDFTGRNKKG